MLRPVFTLILSLAVTCAAWGQSARVFTMDLDGNAAPLLNEADKVTYNDAGGIQGPFGPGDDTTTSGAWREHFYRWMVSNGWVGR